MINGKELIKKAVEELNDAKILPFTVDVSNIDTADGAKLVDIINYFLDSVETISENKENIIPKYVINAYNSIVDKAVTFETAIKETFDIAAVEFKRTKFYD